MVTKQDLDAALHAHMQWKIRIEGAISEKRSDFQPEVVKKDDACEFGRWLHTRPVDVMNTDHYRKVKALHAEFHRVAGSLLDLALSGRAPDARKGLDAGGEYRTITGKLILAINTWKDALA